MYYKVWGMKIDVFPNARLAGLAAADRLSAGIAAGARTLLAATGNSPLGLYRQIAWRRPPLGALEVFALDEYVGVPDFDPRTCGNLLRRVVAEAWGLLTARLHAVSPTDGLAQVRLREHEALLDRFGVDWAVLGLGQNGHLAFNEPGSACDSGARIVPLQASSVEANRKWFDGDYAPSRGATLGLRTILAARRILLLAFGSSKAAAVKAMVKGPPSPSCPASWLQDHPDVHVYLDREAAADL